MEKYICFINDYVGKDNKKYIKNVKYKIRSSDSKYFYFGKEKISKDLLNESYKIGDVIE